MDSSKTISFILFDTNVPVCVIDQVARQICISSLFCNLYCCYVQPSCIFCGISIICDSSKCSLFSKLVSRDLLTQVGDYLYYNLELFSLLFVQFFIYLGRRNEFGIATIITALLWASCHVVIDEDFQSLLFIMAELTSLMDISINSLKYHIIN